METLGPIGKQRDSRSLCKWIKTEGDPALIRGAVRCRFFFTITGLTQTNLETGFLTWIKRLKLGFFVEKPGFCVSPKLILSTHLSASVRFVC